mgnify:CR=1 FL=1
MYWDNIQESMCTVYGIVEITDDDLLLYISTCS